MPLWIAAAVLVFLGCARLRRREPRWLKAVSLGGIGMIVASVDRDCSAVCRRGRL